MVLLSYTLLFKLLDVKRSFFLLGGIFLRALYSQILILNAYKETQNRQYRA